MERTPFYSFAAPKISDDIVDTILKAIKAHNATVDDPVAHEDPAQLLAVCAEYLTHVSKIRPWQVFAIEDDAPTWVPATE
jgi:hypothetical protein